MSVFNIFQKKKKILKAEKKEEKKGKVAVSEKEEKKEKEIKKEAVKRDRGKGFGVLIKPLVSEKASFVGQYGQYIFEVNPKSNKAEIVRAVVNTYGVKPTSVNIVRVRGKDVRYGRIIGRTKDRKKAVITLKPGEKIEVYEGV